MASKTVVTNVFVFDGQDTKPEPQDVTIEGSWIVDIAPPSGALATESGATLIDGSGCTLLPGMIDSHVHIRAPEQLDDLAAAGVTTCLDMACFPPAVLQRMRQVSLEETGPGGRPRPHMLSAGTIATSPGSVHSRIPGLPAEALLTSADQAEKFVAGRVAEGSDYIKLIADDPGPSQAVLDALVVAAHRAGKKSVAHAAYHDAFRMAVESGADCLTHVPADQPVDPVWAQRLRSENRAAVPTLAMHEGVEKAIKEAPQAIAVMMGSKPRDFKNALDSAKLLHQAGVLILAGTDANASKFAPLPHGSSFFRELELLSEAGLTNLEVLRSATSLPAAYWGLEDRGKVQEGLRADLVLVRGKPLEDLHSIRDIQKVFIGGVAF